MKIIFLIISILLLINFLPAREYGYLTVHSEPDECLVRVDSILVGSTPLEQIELDSGNYIVTISPPATGLWHFSDREFPIEVTPGKETKIKAEFEKPVFVNSIPYGAQLITDSNLVGQTPVYLSFEKYKNRSFKLVKEGYHSYHFVLSEHKPVLISLDKKEGFVTEVQKKPDFLGILPQEKIKSKFALLALTVASHWASFYFKNLADDNYEKYLRTADPELIDKYWDNTRKYDRFSEVSLGISYVSLTGLIYLVVWH